jgi:hypothetical protein
MCLVDAWSNRGIHLKDRSEFYKVAPLVPEGTPSIFKHLSILTVATPVLIVLSVCLGLVTMTSGSVRLLLLCGGEL